MRIVSASLAVLASSAALQAAEITVRQTDRANVYGLVQAGPRSPSVEVTQDGARNVLGIVQVAPDARLAVHQSGGRNTALVGQFAPPRGFPARGGMP